METETPPTLRMVIVYEDLSSGLRARQLSARVNAHFDSRLHLRCYLWKFETLQRPALRKRAAQDAANANVVIISASGLGNPPAQVLDWIQQWLAARKDRTPGLVAVLDPGSQQLPAFCNSLRRRVEAMGMDFLFGPVEEPEGRFNRLNGSNGLRR